MAENIDFAEKIVNYVYHLFLMAKNRWENLGGKKGKEKARYFIYISQFFILFDTYLTDLILDLNSSQNFRKYEFNDHIISLCVASYT